MLTEGRRGWLGLLQGGSSLSGSSSASEVCRKWISQRWVVVLVLGGLRAPLMMATATHCHREIGRRGEIHIEERKGEVQRGSRGRWSTMTETFTVYPSSGGVPRAQQPREGNGVIGLVLWVERRGAGGKNGVQGKARTAPEGFILRR
jgi:hypothetical protein